VGAGPAAATRPGVPSGWLAIVAWVFAGIGEALSPASSVIEGLTFIGFVAFFVWMAAMGTSLLRVERRGVLAS
jgi:hypothetical protein